MNARPSRLRGHGPFRADSVREGDRYELSNGNPVYCAPSGPDHAGPNLTGGSVLETDPGVKWAGVDAGYTPAASMLRAPDVAVGTPGVERGWIPGAPPLAVEYAGAGQAEAELQDKIVDLLQAGTKHIWVVRLVGPRRVEVYEPGNDVRVVPEGGELVAPGILKNPVAVRALFDRDAAHEATLRNLLQRRGYESLEAVRAEGEAQGEVRGLAEGLLALLAVRGVALDDAARARIEGCKDAAELRRWLGRAATVSAVAELFAD